MSFAAPAVSDLGWRALIRAIVAAARRTVRFALAALPPRGCLLLAAVAVGVRVVGRRLDAYLSSSPPRMQVLILIAAATAGGLVAVAARRDIPASLPSVLRALLFGFVVFCPLAASLLFLLSPFLPSLRSSFVLGFVLSPIPVLFLALQFFSAFVVLFLLFFLLQFFPAFLVSVAPAFLFLFLFLLFLLLVFPFLIVLLLSWIIVGPSGTRRRQPFLGRRIAVAVAICIIIAAHGVQKPLVDSLVVAPWRKGTVNPLPNVVVAIAITMYSIFGGRFFLLSGLAVAVRIPFSSVFLGRQT